MNSLPVQSYIGHQPLTFTLSIIIMTTDILMRQSTASTPNEFQSSAPMGTLTTQRNDHQPVLQNPSHLCRTRNGKMQEEESFWRHSCMQCYSFKFNKSVADDIERVVAREPSTGFTTSNPSSSRSTTETINSTDTQANADTSFDRLYEEFLSEQSSDNETKSGNGKSSFINKLCTMLQLGNKPCSDWKKCCKSAGRCCKKMMNNTTTISGYCPMTWDGNDCWGSIANGSATSKSCPSFFENIHPKGKSVKTCEDDGTWFRLNGDEYTDYSGCRSLEDDLTRLYIRISFDAISAAMLIPCIIIFLAVKNLRKQFRIKIHLHFFLSLVLACLFSLAYNVFVYYDLFVTRPLKDTVVYANSIWCRSLHFFKTYFNSCTYTWMLCEGIYLHKLLTAALQKGYPLICFVLLGWGLPFASSISYALLRHYYMNDLCWMLMHGTYEWITYIPDITCLLLNLVFLFNIVRIIMFKLRPRPRETSNFRRGFRAALMLVPLFGLHILLTIYRADSYSALQSVTEDEDGNEDHTIHHSTYYHATYYNHVARAVIHSQGIFVSLIYCYLTDEVKTVFRKFRGVSMTRAWT